MYHISNDKRAKKSAKMVADGLIKCAKKKSVDMITISDIQKESTVSRSTFYRLFDNVQDVLQFICDLTAEKIYEEHEKAGGTKEFAINFIQIMMDNTQLLNVLMESNNIPMLGESIEKYLKQYSSDFVSYKELDGATTEYAIRILSATLPNVMEIWMQQGQAESAEMIRKRVHKSLRLLGKTFGQ